MPNTIDPDDTAETASTGARPATPIWRNTAFRLLWSAQTLSDLGTGITTLAYPLLMLALTRSPVQAGAVAAVSSLPYLLFGLVAGALADRWNRKRVMVICDTFRAINMLSIPLAMWLWNATPTHLYVSAFIGGGLDVLFSAADAGVVPNVVEKHPYVRRRCAPNSSPATAMMAPPLGGTLFQLFRGLPFVADAVSYLASAIALSAVRLEFQQSQKWPTTTLRSDISAGLRWLWSDPVIRSIAIAAAGLQPAMAGAELVVIVAAQQAHASAAVIGLVLSSIGVGGVAGSLVASRLKARFGFASTIISVMWAQAALWVLIGLFSHVVLVIAFLLAVFVATAAIFGINALSYQLSITPDDMQSRVGSAFKLIAWSSLPLGSATAGVLLDRFGSATTSLAFGAWVAAIALAASRPRSGLRTRPDHPTTSK